MEKSLEKKCYEFGKEYYGPFLLEYTKWLIKNLKRENITRVFFFSRDGYMMEKAFKMLDLDYFEVSYVYFSRKSIRQALLYKANSYKESLKYLTDERYVSLGKILDYYGLNEENQQEIFKFYEEKKTTLFLFDELKDNKLIEKIYIQYRETINKNSKTQSDLLKKYIFQIGLLGKCGIVDIGWHGSMQYFLEQFFSYEHIDVSLFGYYIGIKPKYDLRGRCLGFLFDANNTSMYKSIMCFHGGYEKLFQSLEGSTIGYQVANDVVVPIKKSYEYAESFSNRITNWQRGALDYIDKKKLNRENSIQKLINFGKNPPLWGIQIFSGFFLDDGQDQAFVSEKLFYQYKLKELKQKLGSSVWKTGFLKSIFKVPGPYFFVYKVMKK